MADMFYDAFNIQAKGGLFESLITAAHKDVEFHSFEKIDITECLQEFHYHLDCESLNLTILNCDYSTGEAEVKTVFCGLVSDFINQNTKENKSIVSYAIFNPSQKMLYTKHDMVKVISKHFKTLKMCHKNPSNPNNKISLKVINRLYCFYSEMDLNKSEIETKNAIFNLLTTYESAII